MRRKSILQFDARISEALRLAEKPGTLRNISAFLAHSGDSWFWALGLIVLWGVSSSWWKQWAVIMLAAISLLAALVMCLKFTIRRRRPEGEWGGIYRNTDPHSFPSGHAARAFLIAVVATGLGPFWTGIVLWIWAPLVSLARTVMGVHYVSDVVVGSIIGIVAGLFVLQFSTGFLSWLESLVRVPLW